MLIVSGLLEFKRVDILWDYQLGSRNPDGELFVKVFMSEHCVPGMLWSTLVNACLPIMELIDWTRSHPDNVHDVSDVNGIDTAWKYFFGVRFSPFLILTLSFSFQVISFAQILIFIFVNCRA